MLVDPASSNPLVMDHRRSLSGNGDEYESELPWLSNQPSSDTAPRIPQPPPPLPNGNLQRNASQRPLPQPRMGPRPQTAFDSVKAGPRPPPPRPHTITTLPVPPPPPPPPFFVPPSGPPVFQTSYSDSNVPTSPSNHLANDRASSAVDFTTMGYPSSLPPPPTQWSDSSSIPSGSQSPSAFSPPTYEPGPATLPPPDQKVLPSTPSRPEVPGGYNSYYGGPSNSYGPSASASTLPPLPPKVSENHPPASTMPPLRPPKLFHPTEEREEESLEPQSSTTSYQSFPASPVEAGPSNAGPSVEPITNGEPNREVDPADAEMDQVLKMSLESFAEESQQAQAAETDEERIMRESLDMYNKQQEIERMAGLADEEEESEEAMMARICALSLQETVQQQQEIERAILQSSNVAGPSSRDWGYGVASGSGSSSAAGPGPSSSRPYGRLSPGPSSPLATRPQIVTSLASPQPSRTPSPRPSQLSPVSPSQPEGSSSTRWANASLPAYEEVISGPGTPPSGLTPRHESFGSAPSGSLASPSGESSAGLAPDATPVWSNSPLEVSPQDDLPIQYGQPANVGAFIGQRPHSRSFAVGSLSPRSSGGSPGLQRSASAQSSSSANFSRGSFDTPRRDFSPSSEDSPQDRLSRTPSYMTSAPFQMPVPHPAEPTTLSDGGTPDSEGAPPQDVRDGLGKRITVEPEYTRGVSFGYNPPKLDDPVIPEPPPVREVITLLPNEAYHFVAPSWHALLRLLARIGSVAIQPAPEAFSILPLTQTTLCMRLVLHFHKCKYGGEWRTVLWMDLSRPLPSSVTGMHRTRYVNGDTTVLPWASKIPEESISGTLRGPSSQEIHTNMNNLVFVLHEPFPTLPTTLSNVAAVLNDAYRVSKTAVSTGHLPDSGIDRGISLKRLHKTVEKIYPANKRVASVATGVLRRTGDDGEVVAVGSRRSLTSWFRSGMGKVVGKEDKGGQWKNEEELADLVTPYSFDH